MRVLFVLPYLFVPPDSGNKNLVFNLLRDLTGRVRCDLAMLVDPGVDAEAARAAVAAALPEVGEVHLFHKPAGLARLRSRVGSLLRGYHPALGGYRSAALAAWLAERDREGTYDVVHFDMVHTAPYVAQVWRTPTLLVSSDAYSYAARTIRRASGRPSHVARSAAHEALFRRYETREYPRFDLVCTVSDVDTAWLRRVTPRAEVRTIRLAVGDEFLRSAPRDFATGPEAAGVLCTGSIDVPWVANGSLSFLELCQPHVERSCPGVRTTFLGRNATAPLRQKVDEAPGADYVAFVQDYRDFLSRDWVYVYPQRCGSGLQTKIQQAMALGLPVVGFVDAFGGLLVQDGVQALVCGSYREMGEAVVRLLRDGGLREEIGLAAARHVRERFSAAAAGEEMLSLYAEIARGAPRAAAAPVR